MLHRGTPDASIDGVTIVDPHREDSGPSCCNTGSLLVGCDWAYEQGDAATMALELGRIAMQTDEPLQTELLELSQLWRQAPDLAARRWPMLRSALCDCKTRRASGPRARVARLGGCLLDGDATR